MSQPDRSQQQTSARDGARTLELAACSDKGPVRRDNQDAWVIRPLDHGAVVILADGMGGHADGAIASHLAVSAAAALLASVAEPQQALSEAVADANRAIGERRGARGVVSGTTLVAAVVRDGRAVLANVGDSRAYLLRNGVARQLTLDHSWLADEVRAGRVAAAGADHDPRRNVLTRALTGEPVEADGFEVELASGDTVVLCSDGVWEKLGGDGLAAVVRSGRALGDEVADAVAAALHEGATDNVTVVACRVS